MPQTFDRLGLLYKNTGIQTSTEIVEKRIAALQEIYKTLNVEKLLALTRITLGIPSDLAELDWFVKSFQENDKLSPPTNGDRETALLASGMLSEAMDSTGKFSLPIALALSVGSFGGVRVCASDPDLIQRANSVLSAAQRSASVAIKTPVASGKLDLTAKLADFDKLAPQNNFANAAATVKDLLTSIADREEQIQSQIVRQLVDLVAHHNRLREETQMHWWVVGGWSSEANKSFASLSVAEATLRAGKELADLTTAPGGPFAAPALLDIVLQKNKSSTKKLKLSDAVIGAPIDWRKSWIDGSGVTAVLLPVTMACALAAESADEPDWKPRFSRVSGLDAEIEISPLDLGVQLFRERLLSRMG